MTDGAESTLYDLYGTAYDVAHPAGFKPRLSYIICSTPRSGSTLLSDGLARLGNAGTPIEYLNNAAVTWSLLRRWSCELFTEAYLRELARRRSDAGGVFGLKVHWDQIARFYAKVLGPGVSLVQYNEHLTTVFPGVKYLFVTRIDKARQAVSYWIASRTGRFFSLDAKNADDRIYLDYDFEEIHATHLLLLTSEARWLEFFASNHLEPLLLPYESFHRAYDREIRSVLRYIGCAMPDGELPRPKIEQQTNGLKEEIVQRYMADLEARAMTPERMDELGKRVAPERRALLLAAARARKVKR
jgi:trehalose 2-sulfotransferase